MVLWISPDVAGTPLANRIFGGCPTNFFRGFLPNQEGYVEGSAPNGTQQICHPPVVAANHRPKNRLECTKDNSEVHPVRPPTVDWLRVEGIGESRHSLQLLSKGELLVKWVSPHAVDCIGNIYLSEDQAMVAIEMGFSKKEFDSLDDNELDVQVFKLPHAISKSRLH